MGTKFAVVGSNLVVAYKEIKLFALLPQIFPQDFVENPSRTLNFLDIQLKIVNNTLLFDIYYKQTNSFNYLTCSSCHPSHTKNNIALSLPKRIINIVTDNREKRLSELKKHLIERNHPPETIFLPKLNKNKDLEKIVFTRTFNPKHVINLNKFTRSQEVMS